MPIPQKYLADFNEHGIYHVYNRTNNKEKLFLSDENYNFFLRNYAERMSPFIDTYCWCLLPNHFHYLVRVKATNMIMADLETKDFKDLSQTEKKFMDKLATTNELIGHSFKRFFQSYSLAFNKMYSRHGNLFYKPFKRIEVSRDTQLTQAIVYVHINSLKHRLVNDFTQYPWSSWKTILSDGSTRLHRKEIIEWFGSREAFIKAHHDLSKFYLESDIAIED
jgi:putative transposase